jgi:hypothetical protein
MELSAYINYKQGRNQKRAVYSKDELHSLATYMVKILVGYCSTVSVN